MKKFDREQYVLFEQEELEGYIGDFLGIERRESQIVLRSIESQHGLLIERSQKIWSFSHLTFQEYLVANSFVDEKSWLNLMNRITHPHWREVFKILSDKGNYFLFFMKSYIDIQLDMELFQDFLRWVYKMSLRVQGIYRPSAARAFYFGLYVDLKFSLAHKIDSKIQEYIDLDTDYSYSRAGAFAQHSMLALEVQLYFMLGRSYGLSNNFDKLPNTHELEASFKRLALDSALALHHASCLADRVQIQELEERLIALHNILPKEDNDSSFGWWFEYGEFWTKQLENIMSDYYDMWVDWNFDSKKIHKLKEYNIANQLLLDCVNYDRYSELDFKKEICEALLLPIAEIEKIKLKRVD